MAFSRPEKSSWRTKTVSFLSWNDAKFLHGLSKTANVKPSCYWPATEERRNNYEIDDEGIHWYALDEDISFESFEYDDPEPQGISRVFLTHPELNASAVARRVGISQSLMAQYINGTKKPSKERESLILNEVKTIGRELVAL